MNKARFAACIMAICYKYLDENLLFQQQIDLAKKLIREEQEFDDKRPAALFFASMLTYVAVPVIFVEFGIAAATGNLLENVPEIKEKDIIELEQILNRL